MRPCSFSIPRPTFKAEGVKQYLAEFGQMRFESVPRCSFFAASSLRFTRWKRENQRQSGRRQRCGVSEKKRRKRFERFVIPFTANFPPAFSAMASSPTKRRFTHFVHPKNFFSRGGGGGGESIQLEPERGRSVASFPANLVTELKSSCKN